MAIKSYKPTTAGRRGMTVTDYSELSKVAPCKSCLLYTSLILDEDGHCIDVKKRTSGESESMIEEFMLLANQCAAHFARVKQDVYKRQVDPRWRRCRRTAQPAPR